MLESRSDGRWSLTLCGCDAVLRPRIDRPGRSTSSDSADDDRRAVDVRRRPTRSQTRPATTTFMGDTGLWFVPTGEVLPAQEVVAERVSRQLRRQPGLHRRVGLAGDVRVRRRRTGRRSSASWTLVQPHRPRHPAAVRAERSSAQAGGVVPRTRSCAHGWCGNQLGDFWLGAKVNLTSQWRQQPAAFAVRGHDQAADRRNGRAARAPARRTSRSTRSSARKSTSGSRCRATAGSSSAAIPDEVDTTNGFRWGFGAGVPSRKRLRFTAELDGEQYSNDTLATKQVLTADRRVVPAGRLHLGRDARR